MNPDWGNAAEPYYHEFFHGKIEEAPEKIIRQADFIIFADILEHLPDPETILRKIVRNQTSGVLFAISVPNIAHLYMRWQLLLGKFEYTEVGIMDRTHLRFFTRKTFEQMLATCGLIIIEKQTTPIPLDLVNPFFSNFKIGRLIHKMYATLSMKWPTMLGYQFVYLCRLPANEEKSP
jgi:predicted TPR repeat methyltransferase